MYFYWFWIVFFFLFSIWYLSTFWNWTYHLFFQTFYLVWTSLLARYRYAAGYFLLNIKNFIFILSSHWQEMKKLWAKENSLPLPLVFLFFISLLEIFERKFSKEFHLSTFHSLNIRRDFVFCRLAGYFQRLLWVDIAERQLSNLKA